MNSLEPIAGPSAQVRHKTICFVAAILASGACAMSKRDAAANEAASTGEVRVEVTGKLTSEGVECQALRGDDGKLYTLLGNIRALPVESRVRVLGERLEFSTCQQGITIRVQSIAPADPDRIN